MSVPDIPQPPDPQRTPPIPLIITDDDDGPPAPLFKSISLTAPTDDPSKPRRKSPARTLSEGAALRGHARKSSFEQVKDLFARASSIGSSRNGSERSDLSATMPAHSRNMSTHSLGSLPSTQRLDLGESIPTPTPAMKYATLARVEHPLSAADSSDSQSDHNVKIGGKTPSPRKHSALLVKAETFSAGTPRSQENTGIIGRMAESETGTPLHRAPSTTLSRPPSPNLSFDERSYTGPTTLPAFGAISYASHKRDHDFHELFPNISEHESLVEDYACALQKDILVQGRMYITDQRICFYASIFAWVTTIFIPFSEIACIEKKTVLLINNALEITTEDGKKYFFASFMQRDIVHSLMIKLWKRDVELMGPTDGYGERCSESVTDLDAEADAEMDMHDDGDGEEPHLDEHDSSTMRRHASADLLGESPTGELARHPSAELLAGSTTATGKSATADLPPIGVSPPKRSDGSLSSMPGATTARKSGQLLHTPSVVSASTSSHATHGASGKKRHKVHHHHRARSPARPLRHTSDLGPLPNASSCECDDHEKYTINMEKTYDLRLHRVWKLLFGIGSEETVRRAVVDFRKNRDFRVETHWSLNGAAVAKDRDDSITSGAKRVLCWVCPLNSALGPKQTRNVHEEIIAHKDLNVFVTVKTSDAALDVPAGDCFKVLEKICLMNAPSHNGRPRTTVRFSGRIEFTKSTWLKSIIEKSALEGIRTYFEDLDKMVTELAAIEDRDLSHLSVEEAEGLRKRVSGAPTTPETPQTAVPVGASGSFEATPISHRIEPPGVVGVAVDILFFLLRFFGGAEGWAPRRIALSLAGFVAIFIVLAHLLLLWKLTTILGEINENLIEMRTSWATAGLRQGVAP